MNTNLSGWRVFLTEVYKYIIAETNKVGTDESIWLER